MRHDDITSFNCVYFCLMSFQYFLITLTLFLNSLPNFFTLFLFPNENSKKMFFIFHFHFLTVYLAYTQTTRKKEEIDFDCLPTTFPVSLIFNLLPYFQFHPFLLKNITKTNKSTKDLLRHRSFNNQISCWIMLSFA